MWFKISVKNEGTQFYKGLSEIKSCSSSPYNEIICIMLGIQAVSKPRSEEDNLIEMKDKEHQVAANKMIATCAT